MGVLACSRNSCENIMCDIYVPKVGYVCWECKGEFVDLLQSKGKSELSEREMEDELIAFMNVEKGRGHKDLNNPIDVYDFFNKHTRQ